MNVPVTNDFIAYFSWFFFAVGVVRLSEKALRRHIYVLGGTGTGKSRLLETWIMQLIYKYGMCIIDAHGELFENILARIAATRDRKLWERVVIINPLDDNFVVGFNPLEIRRDEKLQRKCHFLADVVTKVWLADPLITARMQRMMEFTFRLLATSKLTLLELQWLLTDSKLRSVLLQKFSPMTSLWRYWNGELPPRLILEWAQSTLNKAGSLVDDPDLELIFGQNKSTIDFKYIMDQGYILLVNLSKGELTGGISHMLGAFIMAQIQQSALARANDPEKSRRLFVLFIDEFQNYTTDNIRTMLAEVRKYYTSLVGAHQYYGQLLDSPILQGAILNTVGNIVLGRLGRDDAELFVKDMYQPETDQIKAYVGDSPIYRSMPEIWEWEIRKLTQLADREFWHKERGTAPARKFRSRYLPDVSMTPCLQKAIDELVAMSNERWARPKHEVKEEIEERKNRLYQLVYGTDPGKSKGDVSLWDN